MRAETIRALEVRKNSVMAERRKSAMQTLGAKNEYGIAAVSTVGLMSLELQFLNFNMVPSFQFQLNNNGVIPNVRSGRISNAGINIKDVFNVNGVPTEVSATIL